MKKIIVTAYLFILAVMPAAVLAYEVQTHEEMSAEAARRSVLSKGTLLSDIDAGSLESRYKGMTLMEWVRYGAHHEDDFSSLFFPRFVNHFYNPLTGMGLAGSVFPDVFPSPLWGLEDTQTIRRQAFSLRDALDVFYESLTLPNKSDRDDRLGQTFRTLGHVIHLIQDAAQPQHTRNDSHGTGSVYERLTNEMRDTPGFPYHGYPSADSVVKFDTARSFWHTLSPDADRQAVMNGLSDPNAKGMAEYSNRNFVTLGTNYRFEGGVAQPDPNFPLPAFYPDSVTNVDVAVVQVLPQFANCTITRFDTPPLRGQLTFYGNPVADSYQPSTVTNAYASTLSIFDHDLESLPGVSSRFFALNRFNYCAAQQFLIPRAVSYSAGLIDHFFRGRLEISADIQNGQIELVVKNISGSAYPLRNGTFELYYDAGDGARKLITLVSGVAVDNIGIVDGVSTTVVAIAPNDLDATKQYPFILVFRGLVGEKQAIVGKVFKTSGCIPTSGYTNIKFEYTTLKAECESIGVYTYPLCGLHIVTGTKIMAHSQRHTNTVRADVYRAKSPSGPWELFTSGVMTAVFINQIGFTCGSTSGPVSERHYDFDNFGNGDISSPALWTGNVKSWSCDNTISPSGIDDQRQITPVDINGCPR